jgi:phosphatidylglycerophosphatase A
MSLRGFHRRTVKFLAMGFGAGAMPFAPGTFGTLVGVPVYLVFAGLPPGLYVLVTIALFGAGIWLCNVAQQELGKADHPGIVWDEIVGYLVAMTAAPLGWAWLGIGFLLFRLFDIWKPFPIRHLDRRVHGGFGIMLDDVVAGLYAWLCMQGILLSGIAG